MIKKNQRFLNYINVLLDGLIIASSYIFTTWLWFDVLKHDPNNFASIRSVRQGFLIAGMIYTLLLLLLLALFGLYNTSRIRRLSKDFVSIINANLLGVIIISGVFFAFRLEDFSRGVLIVFTAVDIFSLSLKRLVLRKILSEIRKVGFNQKHILVVGTGNIAQQYARNVQERSFLGFSIDGFIGEMPQEGMANLLGGFMDLESKLKEMDIDEVVIAIDSHETKWITQTISLCEKYGTKVGIIPFYNDIIPSHPTIDIIGDTKLFNLRSNPLDNIGYAALKRMGDIFVSICLVILLSPVMVFIALGILISSPGPILFTQQRVGRNKKLFKMYKFRSMRVNATQDTAWTQNEDARKTRFGSFLRKFSIDELPQLINVIRGEMSLVGPRPEIPLYVEKFKEEIPLYMVKHQVRPGMTGWAQVNGYRGDTSIVKRIEYDVWYIENWTVGLDIKILFQTAFGGWLNHEKIN